MWPSGKVFCFDWARLTVSQLRHRFKFHSSYSLGHVTLRIPLLIRVFFNIFV
jgi:hypothetical protein